MFRINNQIKGGEIKLNESKKNYPEILNKKDHELKSLKLKYQKENNPKRKLQYMQDYITKNDDFWFKFMEMHIETVNSYKTALSTYEKDTITLQDEIKKICVL